MEKQVTDSDSSDDYGPMPSTEKASIEVEQQKRIREIEERTHLKVPRANIPKTSVREEWMMKPPDALRGLGDQKSRQFSMKGKGDLDHSVWTSAPSERERAENDVKKRKIDEETDSAPTASDLAIRAAIKRHNVIIKALNLGTSSGAVIIGTTFNKKRGVGGRLYKKIF